MTVARHSIIVQVLRGTAVRIGAIYDGSMLRRSLRYLSLRLTRWAQGSALINLAWHGDNGRIWRHSLFARLAGNGARVLRTHLDQLSGIVRRSRHGSFAVRLWHHACSGFDHSGGGSIPVRPLLDFGMAFLAVNVGIRLVLQAYTMRSLLLLGTAFLALLLLRLSAEGVEAALKNSRFVRLTTSLFSLRGGSKEVK